MKVDGTYKLAKKVLGGLHRTDLDKGDNLADEQQNQNGDGIQDVSNSRMALEERMRITNQMANENYGDKTIDKNPQMQDLLKMDIEFNIDPLFQKNSAKFDESSARGLLLHNIEVIREGSAS